MTDTASPITSDADGDSFQSRVDDWLIACFGIEIARDGVERNHRFLEDALELVQSCGCTVSEAHQLVDYTFRRPVGETGQEVGGVMNTLAALCLARDLDMNAEGDREIERCWQKIERIREKQRNKPKHSPLPALSANNSIGGLVGAAQPFAKSMVFDPDKKRGDRHWVTYGTPTTVDDVLRLQNVLALLLERGEPK